MTSPLRRPLLTVDISDAIATVKFGSPERKFSPCLAPQATRLREHHRLGENPAACVIVLRSEGQKAHSAPARSFDELTATASPRRRQGILQRLLPRNPRDDSRTGSLFLSASMEKPPAALSASSLPLITRSPSTRHR